VQNAALSVSRKTLLPFLFLSLTILAAYSNSINAAWQMDDKPNILDNQRLHVDNLMPGTLYDTFFASPGSVKRLYRPLPCLTFALNWYMGQDDPSGYRIVNLLIHVLTAILLFSTVKHLFKTPALSGSYAESDTQWVALLSATLWALHPIQIQAVTYIVQRMTSMATLFYIMGLFFYIRGRISEFTYSSLLSYIGCFVAFILSLACKENAATFPVSIILVETAFFSKKEKTASEIFSSSKMLLCTGITMFIAAVFYFTHGNPFSFINGYAHRSFSLSERFLTEFRVIVFYLSQIFYPHPDRFSIDHEVQLSASLTDPWTTLPAILIVAFLLLLGFLQIKKRTVLGFAILFFFLNHIIESTVIPLEIIFEHRNYLPSAFLFVPVASGFMTLLRSLQRKSRFIPRVLIACMALIVVNLGIATSLRNAVWDSTWSLWADAARKAPGNARPLTVLAIELGWNQAPTLKNLNRALYFFHKSLNLYRSNKFQEADILGNIAAIHFKKGEYQKAVDYYKLTLQADPFFIKARYHLAETLAVLEEWEDASQHLDIVLKEGAPRDSYYNLKGFVLLWQDHPQEALPYFRKALSISPEKGYIHTNIGVALSRMGECQNAEWFLKEARRLSPGNILPLFCQVENSLRANDPAKAERYIREVLSLHSLKEVQESLDAIPIRRDIVPISYEMVGSAIKEAAMADSNRIVLKTR
jgi:tetratricopeptide (TPR) repeat protein